jgi:hypothetical protein
MGPAVAPSHTHNTARSPTPVVRVEDVGLVHFDCPPRGDIAPIALGGVSIDMGGPRAGRASVELYGLGMLVLASRCLTIVSEEEPSSSLQYSLLHLLHCRMKSALQLIHVWPQPKQSRRTPTTCITSR